MAETTHDDHIERLADIYRLGLQKQLRIGVSEGMYASCSRVYELATANDDRSAEERLKDIVSFCEPAIRHVKEKEQKEGG